MHDIKFIRETPDLFDAGLKRRNLAPMSADILDKDRARRTLIMELETRQARRNAASKEIGAAKGRKDEAAAAALMAEVAALKEALPDLEAREKALGAEIDDLLARIPNLPADDVPEGADETANVEVKRIGAPRDMGFVPKQHFELGEALGLMDFETATKISGARFVVLKGGLARLERALGAFMLDLHTSEHGYVETNPPLLVRGDAAFGTGNLPKFKEDLFFSLGMSIPQARKKVDDFIQSLLLGQNISSIVDAGVGEYEINPMIASFPVKSTRIWKELEDASFFLTPTAEVSVTNYVRDTIVPEAELPLRYTAQTPCFRSEAGSAGRDTRGMIRLHQFMKVELVSITAPEASTDEHERMTRAAETVLERLGLPYRRVLLSTGDMGFSARKTYDLEVWLPGQGAYREISSCSNCGDFQARRMHARMRGADGKTRLVHTLNGSGVAVGRCLVAVLENYQNADGSITVPDALIPYMGGITRIAKA